MTKQEPTELMILLRIVEVLERRMLRDDRDATESATSHVASIVNNIIASSPSLVFETTGEKRVIMGDNYMTGQAGAVGPLSSAQDMSFSQIWNQTGSNIDLASLGHELGKMRTEMRRTAEGDPEQDLALAEIARAEISAKSNDGPAALEHLRKAGAWALDVAKSIGAEVAVAAIKSVTGL
jgi:hypothetical protein